MYSQYIYSVYPITSSTKFEDSAHILYTYPNARRQECILNNLKGVKRTRKSNRKEQKAQAINMK